MSTAISSGEMTPEAAGQDSRSWRWALWLTAGLLLVGLLGAGMFLGYLFFGAAEFGSVSPEPGRHVNTGTLETRFTVPGFSSGDRILVTVDGAPVSEEHLRMEGDVAVVSAQLEDGAHSVRAEIESSNPFADGRALRTWFTIDSVPPVVDLAEGQKPGISNMGTPISFQVSEEVTATLTLNGAEVPLWHEEGLLVAKTGLGEGRYQAVLDVADQAGNRTQGTWEFFADYTAPEVRVEGPVRWDEPDVIMVARVRDSVLGGIRVTATVGGVEAEVQEVVTFDELYEDLPDPTEVEFVSLREAPPEGDPQGERLFRITAGDLPEGSLDVVVTVADRAGNEGSGSATVLMDSSSQLGARPMVAGAEGNDVVELQRVLARKAAYQGEASGVLDQPTMAALVSYKEESGLGAEPILDRETLHTLLGRIQIDLSERRLYLYDGADLLKTYPVAVGQPRYPTPTGSYQVINKARNPTWTPPPSPWADGLEPVPPGPGNPLGTRWMGLSAPHVGIHGTYASYSIGTAASHGCIRMHIRDVEDLFERVYVGTPVDIVR